MLARSRRSQTAASSCASRRACSKSSTSRDSSPASTRPLLSESPNDNWEPIPLWRDDQVEVRDLWGFYSQYLYLPRLRDANVLLGAIADGVGLITWRQDGFAYADDTDSESGRYVGLRAGEGLVLVDPIGLLIRPEAAEAQLESERAVGQTDDGRLVEEPDPGVGTDAAGRSARPGEGEVLRRFFGTVSLDPTRLGRDASEIGEAVVAHLNGLVGARVNVTLEIQAEIPDGAPEDVVRTVTENALTLRFDVSTGFEAD